MNKLESSTFLSKTSLSTPFPRLSLKAKMLWSILLLCVFSHAQEKPKNLDALLQKVLQERAFESEEFKKREQEFRARRNKRQTMLSTAQRELREEEQLNRQLELKYSMNEKELGVLQDELDLATGNLGELLGVARQVAGEFRGEILNSVVSAEHSGREKVITKITSSGRLPTIQELEILWQEIQKEIIEQGKVVQFSANVTTLDGKITSRPITRVGPFNLISQGQYLSFETQTQQIMDLVKQPQGKFTKHIKGFENSRNDHALFSLDPSRGSLISTLIQSPNMFERIKQGGVVGLVIICVLIFGLSLVVERFIVLQREEKKMLEQIKDLTPREDNPIGRIFSVFEKNQHLSLESLEVKLEEIAISYFPKIENRISTIKILAVLAPLLGLLGTVTGMILTFQSITLFGTGDPKIMAGGISQALVTTVLGLCCAIPLLLCHNFISTKSNRLIQIVEEQTAGLLAKKMQKKPDQGLYDRSDRRD